MLRKSNFAWSMAIATALGAYGGFPKAPKWWTDLSRFKVFNFFVLWLLVYSKTNGNDYLWSFVIAMIIYLLMNFLTLVFCDKSFKLPQNALDEDIEEDTKIKEEEDKDETEDKIKETKEDDNVEEDDKKVVKREDSDDQRIQRRIRRRRSRTIMVEERPSPRVEERPAPRVEERPAPRVEERPAPRVEERPAPRVEERPTPRVEERPTPRVEERPTPSVNMISCIECRKKGLKNCNEICNENISTTTTVMPFTKTTKQGMMRNATITPGVDTTTTQSMMGTTTTQGMMGTTTTQGMMGTTTTQGMMGTTNSMNRETSSTNSVGTTTNLPAWLNNFATNLGLNEMEKLFFKGANKLKRHGFEPPTLNKFKEHIGFDDVEDAKVTVKIMDKLLSIVSYEEYKKIKEYAEKYIQNNNTNSVGTTTNLPAWLNNFATNLGLNEMEKNYFLKEQIN